MLSYFLLKVSKYTREAGVRGLERKLGALCRAAAVHIANTKAKETPHLDGKENIEASTISKQDDDITIRDNAKEKIEPKNVSLSNV